MNTQYKIQTLGSLLLACAGFTACQDAEWDDHYNASGTGSDLSLMEVLKSHEEFSNFVTVLEKTGGDSLLRYNQTFTVWAPTNEVLTDITDSTSYTQIVENHISRFLYNACDLADTTYLRIKMLNGKYQDFTRSGQGYYFADIAMDRSPLVAQNGLVYPIGKVAEYYSNFWELIASQSGVTDSLYHYLSTYSEINTSISSILAGVNDKGQLLYFHNAWMKKYGMIHLEDSVYTMFIPTDEAWRSAYAEIAPYFRTYGVKTKEEDVEYFLLVGYETNSALADSLQDAYTKEMITHDLVFRKKIDFTTVDGDSTASTSGDCYHHPVYLTSGLKRSTASNGAYYLTDRLLHKPTDSWHKPIRIEAETTSSRTEYYATTTVRSAGETTFRDRVSGTKFLEASNKNTNEGAKITFTIPNTLAATYNIYAVFAPACAFDSLAIGYKAPTVVETPDGPQTVHYPYYDADSTQVQFYIGYVHDEDEDGYNLYYDDPIDTDPDGQKFVTHAYDMTRFLVARNFKFPYANYMSSAFSGKYTQTANVRIMVESIAPDAESKMRIDYLLLEPVTE